MKLRTFEPCTELDSKACDVLAYLMTVLQIRMTNFLQKDIDTHYMITIPASVEDIMFYTEFENEQEVWDALDRIFRFNFEVDESYKDGSESFYSCGIIGSVIKNVETGDIEIEIIPTGLIIASLITGARYLSGENVKLCREDIA